MRKHKKNLKISSILKFRKNKRDEVEENVLKYGMNN
jgi:hypothetical protein